MPRVFQQGTNSNHSPTVQALAFVYIMYSKYDRHKKTFISAQFSKEKLCKPTINSSSKSCLDFLPKLFTPNPFKYPYFAIKHPTFYHVQMYIDTNVRSHYAHSATRPVLELHPSNQWNFNWADRSEQFSELFSSVTIGGHIKFP
jgi:hypothetical protein